MNELLQHAERTVRTLIGHFGLDEPVEIRIEDGEEMLVVGGWVTIRAEDRTVEIVPGNSKSYLHLIVEQEVMVPGNRWQPEDADIVEVGAHRSAMAAGRQAFDLLMANIIEGKLELLSWDFEREDEAKLELEEQA